MNDEEPIFDMVLAAIAYTAALIVLMFM